VRREKQKKTKGKRPPVQERPLHPVLNLEGRGPKKKGGVVPKKKRMAKKGKKKSGEGARGYRNPCGAEGEERESGGKKKRRKTLPWGKKIPLQPHVCSNIDIMTSSREAKAPPKGKPNLSLHLSKKEGPLLVGKNGGRRARQPVAQLFPDCGEGRKKRAHEEKKKKKSVLYVVKSLGGRGSKRSINVHGNRNFLASGRRRDAQS